MIHNTSMEIKTDYETYQAQINKLLQAEYGHSVYCYLRRCASAHSSELREIELEGSSDVSGYMYELWKQYVMSGRCPNGRINDGFGFWINSEIQLNRI